MVDEALGYADLEVVGPQCDGSPLGSLVRTGRADEIYERGHDGWWGLGLEVRWEQRGERYGGRWS